MRAHSMARTASTDVWVRLAQPLESPVSPADAGHHSLVESAEDASGSADALRSRLDAIVPGGWELAVDVVTGAVDPHTVRARLTILGVAREDVASGKTLFEASDRALVRAARRFGVGTPAATPPARDPWDEEDHVPAIPTVVEPPVPRETAPAPRETAAAPRVRRQARLRVPDRAAHAAADLTIPADDEFPSCPRCGDIMWDDRRSKRSSDAPDFRCRRAGCGGALWIARPLEGSG